MYPHAQGKMLFHIQNQFEGPNRSVNYTSQKLDEHLSASMIYGLMVHRPIQCVLQDTVGYFDRFADTSRAMYDISLNFEIRTGDVIFIEALEFCHSLPDIVATWRLKGIKPWIIGVWTGSVGITGDAIKNAVDGYYRSREGAIAACVDVNLHASSIVRNSVVMGVNSVKPNLMAHENLHVVSGLDFDCMPDVDIDCWRKIGQVRDTERSRILLFTHRWDYSKNIDLWLKLSHYLTKGKGRDLNIQPVFLTPMKDVPQERIHALDRAGCSLYHTPSKPEYYQALAEAGIVLSLSELESYGFGMIEAGRIGTTIIAPDVSPYNEIFDPSLLFPSEWLRWQDIELMADMIAAVMESGYQPNGIFLDTPLGSRYKETVDYYVRQLANRDMIGN